MGLGHNYFSLCTQAERMRQKDELRKEKEAARLKAANERAIARKLAKESMELIEDERLELMELATLGKGPPSTLSVSFEIVQNLYIFRGRLFLDTSFAIFCCLSNSSF